MGKMHSFSIEGTHAPLTSGLSYKATSSLRLCIKINLCVLDVTVHLRENWGQMRLEFYCIFLGAVQPFTMPPFVLDG